VSLYLLGEAGALSTDRPRDGGEAGAWIYPSTVKEAKNRIDPEIAATKRDADACTTITADERAAFDAFYAGWRQFYCLNASGTCTEPDASIWGLGTQMDQAEGYETRLAQWQALLASKCALSTPVVTPPPAPPDVNAIARWVGIGLGALAVMYIVGQTGLPRLFPRGGRKR
jgi:hypothetical protein